MTLVATQVKRRRGTTAENDAFTGAEGEIVVDTQRHELRVHDGTTQGGFVIPTTETMDFASKSLDNLSENGEARFANKANSDLSNTPSNIDYVIESQEPTTANGYTWYRKYKSGWVEQGGQKIGNKTVSLPITMSDASYETIINTIYDNSGGTMYSELGYVSKTTTSFTKGGNANNFNWVVYGRSAE